MDKQSAVTPMRAARKRLGISQQVLAARVGVTQATITDLERRQITASASTAARIAKELQISELEILYPERYVAPPDDSPPPSSTP